MEKNQPLIKETNTVLLKTVSRSKTPQLISDKYKNSQKNIGVRTPNIKASRSPKPSYGFPQTTKTSISKSPIPNTRQSAPGGSYRNPGIARSDNKGKSGTSSYNQSLRNSTMNENRNNGTSSNQNFHTPSTIFCLIKNRQDQDLYRETRDQ